MPLLFDLPENPSLSILGEDARFPVRRVFCVGRNYEAHAREMGFEPEREAPIWFTKSAWALCPSPATIAYPPGTANCHYEVELVVAIDTPGARIAAEDAMDHVMGYACGLDLTRRDLQNAARDKGYPWDTGKDFENAAVVAPITRKASFGSPDDHRIALTRNGKPCQDARLAEMIWSVPELIADLSRMYRLEAGDIVFTGTPAGVGPVEPGDALEGTIDGLAPLRLSFDDAD